MEGESHEREVIKARDDVRKTQGLNGKDVHIVRKGRAVENCPSERANVHLSTDRGIWCVPECAEVVVTNASE